MGRLTTLAMMVVLGAGTLGAQQWNEPRVLDLVRQATQRRAQQLADSGLVDYRATAHGYLTFLAQLGEGFREPPRVVKADELALEVYWRAPNLSKQRIVGRRDTTLLPTDIQYHRDHLGIVQNNFPAIIRLGDGDEVQDVPHPLSAAGMAEYDFAMSDSLRISSTARVINVYEVKVRPRDDRQPRVIGAVYIDRDDAQVVRMALSFTRAAFLDKQLEDLFVVLENGIVGSRYWLPRRQEVEIRRTATWLDYPARGIIRGRWEIEDYQLNQNLPLSLFAGPEIVSALPQVLARHHWPSARILDSLPPDVRAVTAEEIRRVQAEVRTLVRDQALRGSRGSALSARSVSDFIRFNRVEGLALGGGWTARLGGGVSLSTRGRYGFSDEKAKGRARLSWENAAGTAIRVFGAHDFAELGDVPERSMVMNSLASQELASDYTDPYQVTQVGVGATLALRGFVVSLDGSRERHRALGINATPATGTFNRLIDVAPVDAWRGTLQLERPTTLGLLGVEYRASAQLRWTDSEEAAQGCAAGRCPASGTVRASAVLEVERPLDQLTFRARTQGGTIVAAGDAILAQDLVYAGGPLSASGHEFHSLVGDRFASQRLGLAMPLPFPSFSLGRFGRSPGRIVVEPHVTGAWLGVVSDPASIIRADAAPGTDPLRPRESGFHPSAGMSFSAFFETLRFDVSHAFRDRQWIVTFDFARPFWSIM